MSSNRHYVPIVKTKAGELRAVESSDGKGVAYTPVFEVCRADQSLADSARATQSAWGVAAPVFADAFHVEQSPPFGDGAIDVFATAAHAVGLRIIPVTGLYRPPAQQAAVRAAATTHGLGACVRLTSDDIDDTSQIDALCANLASSLGISLSQLHAIIDLGEVGSQYQNAMRHIVREAIGSSSFLSQTAPTLTLAGTAFPASMQGIPRDGITPINRSEWSLWQSVCANWRGRRPSFGDYAASHPSLVDFDPETMTPAAKVIYTVDLAWLAAKGRAVNGPAGYGQYRVLAAQIRNRHEFRGPNFSAGDRTIDECATSVGGTGNLTTWVTAKVSHHIAHVVDQIANLPAT